MTAGVHEVLECHCRQRVETGADGGKGAAEDAGDEEPGHATDVSHDLHHEEGEQLILGFDELPKIRDT